MTQPGRQEQGNYQQRIVHIGAAKDGAPQLLGQPFTGEEFKQVFNA
jgi:hypothetical protein